MKKNRTGRKGSDLELLRAPVGSWIGEVVEEIMYHSLVCDLPPEKSVERRSFVAS